MLRRSTATQACACVTLPSAGGHRAAGSAVAGGSGCDDVRPTSPAGIFKRSRSLRVRFHATGVTGGRQSGCRPSPCGSTNQAGSGAWLFGCARQHVAPRRPQLHGGMVPGAEAGFSVGVGLLGVVARNCMSKGTSGLGSPGQSRQPAIRELPCEASRCSSMAHRVAQSPQPVGPAARGRPSGVSAGSTHTRWLRQVRRRLGANQMPRVRAPAGVGAGCGFWAPTFRRQVRV